MHFVCFIEDSVPEGEVFREPKMIIGPKLETKLPKEGIEVRNLTPVNEDQDEREEGTNGTVPHGPRPLGDGGKGKKFYETFKLLSNIFSKLRPKVPLIC